MGSGIDLLQNKRRAALFNPPPQARQSFRLDIPNDVD